MVAWAGEVLVSEEDKDGGSAGDGFGDRMEGESEFWTECPSKELSLLGQGLSHGKLLGVLIVMHGCAIIVDLWQEGKIASFEHLLHKFVDPG